MAQEQTYNEQELLQQLVAGDKAAFETLFRRYFQPIYNSLLQYIHRHADAEDITQQVFVTLWEKRHLLAGVERLDKWLFTAALNEFRMRFRKLRSAEQYQQFLTETFTEEYGSPEDTLILKQRDHLVRKALDTLSDRQRQAYQLSREAGLTYAAIAKEMGLEPATVKEHISRALRSIKHFILENREAFSILVIPLISYFF